jgi:hypothetical protein
MEAFEDESYFENLREKEMDLLKWEAKLILKMWNTCLSSASQEEIDQEKHNVI